MSFIVKGNRWNQTFCTVPYAYTSVSQVRFEICTPSKYNLLNNLCLTTLAGSKRSLTICVHCLTVSIVHIFIFWNSLGSGVFYSEEMVNEHDVHKFQCDSRCAISLRITQVLEPIV
jgi:hypothetical protein